MQQYDIATKVLIEACRDELIRKFLNIQVKDSRMILPTREETVNVRRSDYPVIITDASGGQKLVVLEIQTVWNRNVPLRLLEYRSRHLIDKDLEAVSCVVLLRPSGGATEFYEDAEVRFSYRLVKIHDMDAEQIISEGPLCLMPFVPLILSGDLILKRRNIMIESPAYDMIRKEAIQDGIKEGIQQGELALLKRQIIRRFGRIPPWVDALLDNADTNDIELWADRIFDAASIEDLFEKTPRP